VALKTMVREDVGDWVTVIGPPFAVNGPSVAGFVGTFTVSDVEPFEIGWLKVCDPWEMELGVAPDTSTVDRAVPSKVD
jgi:hypothetical protein